MGQILDEMNDVLMHYGVKRRSGRYPWGSGENPYQRTADFLSRVEQRQKEGLSEKDIAKEFGLSTGDLRTAVSYAKHERRNDEAAKARSMRGDGKTLVEIANALGYNNESSIRALLNENTQNRRQAAIKAADTLEAELKSKGILDVGKGAETALGISSGKLDEALLILRMRGYNVDGVQVPQVTNPNQKTTVRILYPGDMSYGEAWKNISSIKSVADYHSTDGGKTFKKLEYPSSVDSKRVDIVYAEHGGSEKDGLIEIRPGVKDLSLGNSHYAQVRILVDGSHYLKGMAVYNEDLPEGVDIRFNTSKKESVGKMGVLKKIKTEDPKNPFGAAITAAGQSYYTGDDGKEHLSAINKIKWEGDWEDMDKNLSSQFLSKQPLQLINKQLNLTYADYQDQYNDILALTNKAVKKKLLNDFADTCEGAAIHLKAAALPRQKTQVLIPIPEMKDNEVYAPNFRDGERVVLIRYPHAGTFEIPELVVNNKNTDARKILSPDSMDAIGINSKVAARLSGADFDGDQVVVIPVNDKVKIKTSPAIAALEKFDPHEEYAERPGMRYMTKAGTQKQMGMISNLITDMTLQGVPVDSEELVRAVKHSMVVIDAEKHKLDYVRSAKENGIDELKNKYQIRVLDNGTIKTGGASTLLSRRKQDIRVPERVGSPRVDRETGKKVYKESGRTYIDANGNEVQATTKVKLLSTVDDVRSLSSGTPQENAYADYANKMIAMGNAARLEIFNTGRDSKDPQAAKIYADEVKTLTEKLTRSEANAPVERQAQVRANAYVNLQVKSNNITDKKEIKKLRQRAIEDARADLGSVSRKDSAIDITPREWEAIQAHAISESTLTRILKFADMETVRKMAMPRESNKLSDAKINKIHTMIDSGYTNQQIADALGVSVSTVYENSGRKE